MKKHMSSFQRYLLLLLCSSLVCLYIFQVSGKREEKDEIQRISCIYRGSAEEYSSSAIKQGIEQACQDFDVEITTRFLNGSRKGEDQIALIEKEMKNEPDILLIEPLNDLEVNRKLKEMGKECSVILINTGIQGSNLPVISCDNRALGEELAEAILQDGVSGNTVLMAANLNGYQDIQEQYQGAKDILQESSTVEEIELTGTEEEKKERMIGWLRENRADCVVVFGRRDLEMLGELKRNFPEFSKVQICGIGRSNQIITDMEEDLICKIGIANDYGIGYLSVKCAVEHSREKTEIWRTVVDKEQIYEKENQRRLFTLLP